MAWSEIRGLQRSLDCGPLRTRWVGIAKEHAQIQPGRKLPGPALKLLGWIATGTGVADEVDDPEFEDP